MVFVGGLLRVLQDVGVIGWQGGLTCHQQRQQRGVRIHDRSHNLPSICAVIFVSYMRTSNVPLYGLEQCTGHSSNTTSMSPSCTCTIGIVLFFSTRQCTRSYLDVVTIDLELGTYSEYSSTRVPTVILYFHFWCPSSRTLKPTKILGFEVIELCIEQQRVPEPEILGIWLPNSRVTVTSTVFCLLWESGALWNLLFMVLVAGINKRLVQQKQPIRYYDFLRDIVWTSQPSFMRRSWHSRAGSITRASY